MVDVPGAIAAAGGDLPPEGILESAPLWRRIDADVRDRGGEFPGKDQMFGSAH
jgi:hypothetical protein